LFIFQTSVVLIRHHGAAQDYANWAWNIYYHFIPVLSSLKYLSKICLFYAIIKLNFTDSSLFPAGGELIMNREQALEELKARLFDSGKIRHSLAVEAIMKEMAKRLHEETEIWGLTGLLHDIDYDIVGGDMEQHGLVAETILEGLSVDSAIIYSIKSHNPRSGLPRRRKIDKALYCSAPLPGFIEKCAETVPGGISGLSADYLLDKFNEEGFINKQIKEQISSCSELGLSPEELFDIGLNAMISIQHELY